MTVDFDDTTDEVEAIDLEEEEAEEASTGSSPFRIILLVLLLLVLACVVCFLGVRTFGDRLPFAVPGLPIGGPQPTAPPAVVETPTAEQPTDVAQVPTEETEEPAPATEEPPAEEPTATEAVPTEEGQVVTVEEPTEELVQEPTEAPTEVLVDEHDGDMAEPTATATTVPVPGPTSTPAPTVVVTVENCDNNTPPVAQANGPYTAMMGKGQAIITFDGSGSDDPDGTIEVYEWDFGDGSASETGESVSHGYTSTGSFVATLTVVDNCGDSGQDTADVSIVGPTPPADGNGTVTPTTTPQASPTAGTPGFCHRVQYRETLSGLAWHYGVSLRDLADVNGVSQEYFVIAGQGLFIPTDEITGGPNIYQAQNGDTLNSVAYQCGLTVATLAQANNLDVDDALAPGQNLIIPPWRQVNP